VDVLKLVKEEKREDGDNRQWLAVDPAVVYPAMLDYFTRALKDPTVAASIPGQYRPRVVSLSMGAITMAGQKTKPDTREGRAQVLDLARLVFTELLHVAIEHKPMGIHILKNEAWKL